MKIEFLRDDEVKAEKLADGFSLLDEFLKARAAQGLTQAQMAEKIEKKKITETRQPKPLQAL